MSLHTYLDGYYLKNRQPVLARMWMNWNVSTLLVRMINGVATMKTMCRFLKKLILELLNDATIAFLGMYRRELQTRSQKDIWISTFTEALFTITKRWKQPKCPSLDEWIKKRWYVCACIYINIMCYSVLKKKSVLSNATKWMKLEDIMLSEIS